MDEQLEEGQLVLCTVEKMIGTTVFVKVEGDGEGTITFSEIAPGRIRNIRDYIVPGKKIVCKVLHIREKTAHLSFRRVTQNERKELLARIEKEKSSKAILKTVLGEIESEKLIEKITSEKSLYAFFEEIKENPKILEKFISKDKAEKILKILESKKEKPKEIKQIFKLSSKNSNGISIVKNIIQNSCKGVDCDIRYLTAGKYSLKLTGKDFKEIKTKITQVLSEIEKQAKKYHCDFSMEKS